MVLSTGLLVTKARKDEALIEKVWNRGYAGEWMQQIVLFLKKKLETGRGDVMAE